MELYINKQLCDLGGKQNIFFKRVFINPTELATKDAQLSYSIEIPATYINNNIFHHINIEDVQGKFVETHDAYLVMGGVKVFDGKFRLSEITRNSYKGNLLVYATITAKDVFGDMTLNNAGSWTIDNFKGFDSISDYNKKINAECIFPLVLYGLLPKSQQSNGEYTPKDVLDNSVTLGLDDFIPSVNCIEMLRKVFANSGYNLSGTALTDERLANLYMSYKNPNEYEFDWGTNPMRLRGTYRHYRRDTDSLENKYSINGDRKQYAVNIFDSKNHRPNIGDDIGGNISVKGETTNIIIPRTGLYKIRMSATLIMLDDRVDINGAERIGVRSGSLNDAPIEIQLVKNLDKTLDEIQYDNKFSFDNIDQEYSDESAIFPQPHRVNFIDPKQDKNLLNGFAFGRHHEEEYRNPLNPDNCNPIAISGGLSWNFESGNGVTDRTRSAVYSPYYRNRDEIEKGFKVDLLNADTKTWRNEDSMAGGEVMQVVWLEKGDRLDLLTTTRFDIHVTRPPKVKIYAYIHGYNLTYSLDIEPFSHFVDWLKVDATGSSTEPMDWNDQGTFVENQIDLIKSLPSEVKVNDWIDNFCKAFNLILHNTGGNNFRLDLKSKSTIKNTSKVINLDEKLNVNQSINQPLNVPNIYELGFIIDTSEEGYYKSIKEFNEHGEPILSSGDNGGGIFNTGSNDASKVTQTSNFSYCWYKPIEYSKDGSTLMLPVITDKEIWEHDYDTKEMLSKKYFDKSLRFWYKSGVKEIDLGLERTATIALVSNEYNGNNKLELNYKNKANSIMSTYFMLLTNQRNYTVVECYLTPEEYSDLDISLVCFNGDLYNIAEIDGYDPLGKNKATLKLIRKVL